MKEFLIQQGIPFDGDFIKIPDWVKHIKIDVGLSSNAPQSECWFQKEDGLLVFGFEPVASNCQLIKSGKSKWPIKLNPERINKQFFLIQCALGNVEQPTEIQMFVTKNDSGCSSLLKPHQMEVQGIETVKLFSLKHFLQYFPFHQFPWIEYLKTDCQGTDINIIRGCSEFIHKFAIITCEAESRQYIGSQNNTKEAIIKTLSNLDFKHIHSPNTDDPTFKNNKYKGNDIYFYQKG